jgi:endonuclease/exonuclease/phosphatase family metal-dependent hydrolase
MLFPLRATAIALLVLVGQTAADEIRIGTWNLEWFNDHDASDDDSEIGPSMKAPNEQEYQSRVRGFGAAIADLRPHVMALQEVENEKVVADLARQLRDAHGLRYQVAFVQGNDSYTGQDVAALVREGIDLRARRFRFTFHNDSRYKSLSKHLWLSATIDGQRYEVVAAHLVTQPAERIKQARTLRAWIKNRIDENLIVLGDLNASLAFNETTPDSDIGILRGFDTPSRDDDLFDVHQRLANRRTHVGGQELDRILLAPSLVDDEGTTLKSVEIRRDLAIRGQVDPSNRVDYRLSESEQDLSDHFPLVVTFGNAAN